MSEQQITMEDDVSDVVRMLAERMESNPEDFLSSEAVIGSTTGLYRSPAPRFERVYDAVKRYAGVDDATLKPTANPLWYLNEAEFALLLEAARKMSRRVFEVKILETLYAPKEEVNTIAQALQGAITTGRGVATLGQAAQNQLATDYDIEYKRMLAEQTKAQHAQIMSQAIAAAPDLSNNRVITIHAGNI